MGCAWDSLELGAHGWRLSRWVHGPLLRECPVQVKPAGSIVYHTAPKKQHSWLKVTMGLLDRHSKGLRTGVQFRCSMQEPSNNKTLQICTRGS